MRMILAMATLFAVAGCGPSAANNAVANSTNVVAEEGVQDLNSVVGGDELAPVPEADDDLADGARPRVANEAAPPVPTDPVRPRSSNETAHRP